MQLMFLLMLMAIIMSNILRQNNPNIMILALISITIASCINMWKSISAPMIAYSLFLMFVGGLMILFILMASIIPMDILKSTRFNMMWILIFLTASTFHHWERFVSPSNPFHMFESKMSIILFLILLLNLTLMLISKMIMSPIKPYRSIN